MTVLTPGEYDDLPPDVKAQLAQIVRHPRNDTKSKSFRHRYGKFLNGDLDADPVTQQRVGYGTGSRLAPP